jgi:xylulokinase
LLIGGAAKNPAVQQIAADFFGKVIYIPRTGEYVADGAAKQAAWALTGKETPPMWGLGNTKNVTPTSFVSSQIADDYLQMLRFSSLQTACS